MKIGFDVSDLCTNRADGTTRYTRELAKRFPQMSLEDEWHYFGPCRNLESGIWNLDSENYKFEITNSKFHYYASPWPKYWTQSRLPWDLYRYQPDVMFMPIQQIPFIRPGKMKTVAVVHDLAFQYYPQETAYKDWMLQQLFTAYMVRNVDQLIAVSQATANDVAKYYGRAEGVSVIHHGVDHERFGISHLEPGIPNVRKPYILYVGQIQPRKNLIRLIQAFEILRQKDKDLQLVIVGSHGWRNAPIYRYMGASPARDSIIQLGRVSDDLLPALYEYAEVFVLPSLYEGFGMPILEAMACGCPVVTSNVSCLPEVAGEAAVLVDPLSVPSLVEGIRAARGQRAQLREKGIQRAQQFTWETTAQKTVQAITL